MKTIIIVTLVSLVLSMSVGMVYGKDNPVVVMETSEGTMEIELYEKEAPGTVQNFLWYVDNEFFDGLIFHRVIKGFMLQGGCPLGNGSGDPGYKFEDEIDAKGLGLDKMRAFENGQPHQWLKSVWQGSVMRPLFQKLGIKSQADLDKRKAEVNTALEALTILDVYENLGYSYTEKGSSKAPKKGVLAMANSGPNTNGSQVFINLADTPWLTGKHTVFGKVIGGMDIVEKIGEVKVSPRGNKPLEDVKFISIRRVKPRPDEAK